MILSASVAGIVATTGARFRDQRDGCAHADRTTPSPTGAVLFAPQRPAAVVLYAGENDVAERGALAGSSAGEPPFLFIALKPGPARLPLCPAMAAANDAVRALDDAGAPTRRYSSWTRRPSTLAAALT